jgi:immune inhibitor A
MLGLKKVLCLPVILIMLLASFASPAAVSITKNNGANLMPACEEKIQSALKDRKVIPAKASEKEAQDIVKSYLQKKFDTGGSIFPSPKDVPSPKGRARVEAMESTFKGDNGKESDTKAKNIPNAQALPLKNRAEIGKILVLLVEFGADPGPLAGSLPKPADPNRDFWLPNFDNPHYQQMLFDQTPGANSLANYYLAQSDGLFTVEGGVYGWIRLSNPESYYGADAATGNDNLNGPAWRIVKDAIAAGEAQGVQIPYKDFDKDGDGYVDSLMVIHAGAGQEGGGGAQGDDAIWSHSWSVDPVHGGVKTNDGTMVGPYTIEPEDGAVGVFAHEYGHQLGLPDLYDTTYIGEASTGFYTLMSSGSWLGKPLGTQPANLDIWSKMVLGWTPDLTAVNAGSSGIKDFYIHSDETYASYSKGFRVNLPAHPVTTNVNFPFEGLNEYWSDMGDDINTSMTRTVDLTGVTNPALRFKTWYNIEYDYDYGYIEVAPAGSTTFTKIPGNITRDVDGIPSIDGTSGSTSTGNDVEPVWVDAVFDLSAYNNQVIQLRMHYVTDGGVAYQGWAIDNVSIDGISGIDTADDISMWTLNGFRQFAGSETTNKAHYYIGQLVRAFGTNVGLNAAYNYYGDNIDHFKYNTGILLWYRDTAFIDNNVGLHPGQGRLLLVDSQSEPLLSLATGMPMRTRVQIYDAPFAVNPTSPLTLYYNYINKGKVNTGVQLQVDSKAGVSVFDDSKSYYVGAAPYNSVITPQHGVQIIVCGISEDGSAARIQVIYK